MEIGHSFPSAPSIGFFFLSSLNPRSENNNDNNNNDFKKRKWEGKESNKSCDDAVHRPAGRGMTQRWFRYVHQLQALLSLSLSLFLSLFLSFSLSLFLCVLFPSNMERWTRFECLSNAGPNHSSLLLCSVCFHRLIMQIAEPQLLFLSNRVPFDTGVLRTPFKRWPEYHLFKRHEKPQICY